LGINLVLVPILTGGRIVMNEYLLVVAALIWLFFIPMGYWLTIRYGVTWFALLEVGLMSASFMIYMVATGYNNVAIIFEYTQVPAIPLTVIFFVVSNIGAFLSCLDVFIVREE
jgi:hypothetical protein